jgi:hypothetical protein
MGLPERVAKVIVQRPGKVWAWLGLVIVCAVCAIVFRAKLNSDVLEMLPGHFESVGIYKLADREFSSATDLAFALLADSDDVDMDAFATHFTSALAKEPWAVRVMEGSPVQGPGGLAELRAVALPLMLNQDDVSPLVAALQPDAITLRMAKLRAKLEAGVGLSQAELEYDPLGIVVPALKSVRPGRAEPVEDSRFRVVMVHCRQESLSESACNETMAKVEDFKRRVVAAWPKDGGPQPQILCTGRTAYVAEMAGKLKGDFVSTLLSSIVLVALTFYAGFRRWKPLGAIVGALGVTCVLALGVGALLFGALNMITLGLCSILVGLGVDFAMVLYALYVAERERGLEHEPAVASALRAHGSGIWFGAVTTAAAFLTLMWSGSAGYRQLGVLVACGILIAAFAMMILFWLFLGVRLVPAMRKVLLALFVIALIAGGAWIVRNFALLWTPTSLNSIITGIVLAVVTMVGAHYLCRFIPKLPAIAMSRPWRILGPGIFILGGLTIAAFLVGKSVPFDLDPKSLEPAHSNAGHALRTIMARTNPDKIESVLAVIEAPDVESLSSSWKTAEAAWMKLIPKGMFTSVSTPAGLAMSPERMTKNAALLGKSVDLSASRAAFDEALKTNDFPPEQFAPAAAVLDALSATAKGELSVVDWKRNLPESSAWWFLIDGSLSSKRPVGIGHLKPAKNPANEAEVAALRDALAVPGVKVGLSGWNFTLTELAGWSGRKMTQLTVLMLALNVVLLTILLRAWKPVVITMLGLLLSVGAMFTTLKFVGVSLNLFNILAFPLVLGVGVDYGIYIALAMRSAEARHELATLMKPLLLSGLTTCVGFASLAWAENPALRGLGLLCGIGVGWCLIATFAFVLPACAMATGTSEKMDVTEK